MYKFKHMLLIFQMLVVVSKFIFIDVQRKKSGNNNNKNVAKIYIG